MISNNETDDIYIQPILPESQNFFDLEQQQKNISLYETANNTDVGDIPLYQLPKNPWGTFTESLINERNAQKFYDSSNSKFAYLDKRFKERNTIIVQAGFPAVDITSTGFEGYYTMEDIVRIEEQTNKIRAELPPELQSSIQNYSQFIEEAKITAADLEYLRNKNSYTGDESFFNRYAQNLKENLIVNPFDFFFVNAAKSIPNSFYDTLGKIAGSVAAVYSDPLETAVNVLTLPINVNKLVGITQTTGIAAATEGLITQIYVNPYRQELGLPPKDLYEVVKGTALTTGAFLGAGYIADTVLKRLFKIENKTTEQRAYELQGQALEYQRTVEGYAVEPTIDIIKKGGNLEEAPYLDYSVFIQNHIDALKNIQTNKKVTILDKNNVESVNPSEIRENSRESIDALGILRSTANRAEEQSTQIRTANNASTTTAIKTSETTAAELIGDTATISGESGAATTKPRVNTGIIDNIYPKIYKQNIVSALKNFKNPQTLRTGIIDFVDTFRNITEIESQTLNNFLIKHLDIIDYKNLKKDKNFNLILANEMWNQNSNNEKAIALRKGWLESNNYFIDEARKTGIDIKKNIDNYLPQIHNLDAIRNATKNEWISFSYPLLDWEKIEKNSIARGYKTLDTDAKKIRFLSNIYDNITLNKSKNKQSLAKRLTRERILFFKNGESFIQYQDKFGNTSNIIEIMESYLNQNSKNLATLKHFTYDNRNFIDFLITESRKEFLRREKENPNKNSKTFAKAEKMANEIRTILENSYDLITGQIFIGEENFAIKLLHDFTNLSVSGLLTNVGAQTALITPVFTLLTGSRIGLSWFNILKNYSNLMFNSSKEQLQKTQILTDILVNQQEASRIKNFSGHEIVRKFTDTVLRYSGYYYFQRTLKLAFQLEMFNFLARNRSLTFEQLVSTNRDFAKTLLENNITNRDWDQIRKINPIDYKGQKFISPNQVNSLLFNEEITPQLNTAVNKWNKLISQELLYAIPDSSLSASARLKIKTPSLFLEKLANSSFLFSNFPLTSLNLVSKRWVNEPNNLIKLLIGSMTMSLVYVQAKTILDGKTPTLNKNTFEQALYYSGFLPYFVSTAINILNPSYTSNNPIGAYGIVLTDILNVNKEIYKNIVNGKGNPGRATVSLLKDIFPFKRMLGSNLLLDRVLFDQLQRAMDSNAKRFFDQKIKQAEKKGTPFWWGPNRR